MFLKLCVLFVAVPCVELVLLTSIGKRIGLGPTLGVILLTGVTGAWLARQQGARAWRRVRDTLAAGGLPTSEVLDAVLIFAAGLLLLTPGFLTDAVGFGLLVPWARGALRRRLTQWFTAHAVHRVVMPGSSPASSTAGADANTVEGTVIRVEDADAADDAP